MKPKETGVWGMKKENGSANTMLSSRVSKQLTTKSCARCAGLLVTEWYHDMLNSDEHHNQILRCVQCGQRIDPVILHNKIRWSIERRPVPRVRHTYVKTMLLGKVEHPQPRSKNR